MAMNVPPKTVPGTAAKRVHRQVVLTRSQAWETRLSFLAFLGFLVSMPYFFRSDSSRVDFITGDAVYLFHLEDCSGFIYQDALGVRPGHIRPWTRRGG